MSTQPDDVAGGHDMARRYRLDQVFLLPVYNAVQAIRRARRPRTESVVPAITLDS